MGAMLQRKEELTGRVEPAGSLPPPLAPKNTDFKYTFKPDVKKVGGPESPLQLGILTNQYYFRWAQSGQTGDAISITITMPEQIFARRIASEKANVAIVRIWVVRIEEHNVPLTSQTTT